MIISILMIAFMSSFRIHRNGVQCGITLLHATNARARARAEADCCCQWGQQIMDLCLISYPPDLIKSDLTAVWSLVVRLNSNSLFYELSREYWEVCFPVQPLSEDLQLTLSTGWDE